MPSNNGTHNQTVFDTQIAELEKRKQAVLAEKETLLKGIVTLPGPGGHLIEINLGALGNLTTGKSQTEQLKQVLSGNPIASTLLKSTGKGEAEVISVPLPRNKLLALNVRLNQKLGSKNETLGRVAQSKWLLLVGIIVLCLWGGMPLLYLLTGGSFGGRVQISPRPTPTISISATANTQRDGLALLSFQEIDQTPVPSVTPILSATPIPSATAIPQVSALATETPNVTVTAEVTPEPDPGAVSSDRVGKPRSEAGGNNGTHGAFTAPNRMLVKPLKLDVPITRALTQEGSNNAQVSWPRPGEVTHFGVYPGELGNAILMGNQADLAPLRRLQENDEIHLYDRKGNDFIYKVIPFSPNGQTERVIDPTLDGWIFEPTDAAILTIVTSMPQPLPAIDPSRPKQAGSGLSSEEQTRDDYTSKSKLAYRAVLAGYSPVKETLTPIPVIVPDSVWQAPASVTTATTTQNAPETIEPTIATTAPTPLTTTEQSSTQVSTPLPNLPNTGGGDCQHNPCT